MQEKSPVLAAVLGFLFGGLGLFYVSIQMGLIAVAAIIVVGLLTGGAGAPFVWIGCGIWGYMAADNYNQDLRTHDEESGGWDEPSHQVPPQQGPGGNGASGPERGSNSWKDGLEGPDQ